ncbi:MAG: AAA family ATPase [Clostridiales bacterium]|nr:AAA family ATPase [Clostridiales bacterium]
MKIQLAICLKDPEYGARICRYLNTKGGARMEARCIEERAVPERMEILLTDTERIQTETGNAIFMGTQEEAVRLDWDGPRVDPYISGPKILSQCLEQAARIKEQSSGSSRLVHSRPDQQSPVYQKRNDRQGEGGKILAVYAPSGGAGTTVLAMTLADLLAAKGKKVLYLDLESISAWRQFFRSDAAYNLSDFLYNMLLDTLAPEEAARCLEDMTTVQTRKMFFIEPCNGGEDLLVLEPEEQRQLLAVLRQAFDYVVCDLDTCLTPFQMTVLTYCDARVWIRAGNTSGRAKWEDLVSVLRRKHKEEILQDAHCVHVRIGAGAKERKTQDLWDLPWEKDLFQEKEGLKWIQQNSEWYKKAGALLREVERLAGT